MDHTDVGLRAAARALRDVVSPAVDPNDSRAKEQLRLSIDYIEFVLGRVDYLHDRELFDLRHHLGMARSVKAITGPFAMSGAAALEAAIERGEWTLATPQTRMRQLKDATAALAAAIAAIVREGSTLEKTNRSRIEHCVLGASNERIAFERSWYLPLGFDPDPADVRPLDELIK